MKKKEGDLWQMETLCEHGAVADGQFHTHMGAPDVPAVQRLFQIP